MRVGNAASEQLQLDVYGEVIDALYQTRVHGAPADDNIWSLTLKLLEWLEDGWRLEDAGIWEVRGPEPALHALQGDGLGRLRPRRALVTTSSDARGRSSGGATLRDEIRRRCSRTRGAKRSRPTRSPTAPTSSTRASC